MSYLRVRIAVNFILRIKKKLLFELTINLGRSVNHCVCCMCVLDLCHTILLAVKGSFRPIKRQKS